VNKKNTLGQTATEQFAFALGKEKIDNRRVRRGAEKNKKAADGRGYL